MADLDCIVVIDVFPGAGTTIVDADPSTALSKVLRLARVAAEDFNEAFALTDIKDDEFDTALACDEVNRIRAENFEKRANTLANEAPRS